MKIIVVRGSRRSDTPNFVWFFLLDFSCVCHGSIISGSKWKERQRRQWLEVKTPLHNYYFSLFDLLYRIHCHHSPAQPFPELVKSSRAPPYYKNSMPHLDESQHHCHPNDADLVAPIQQPPRRFGTYLQHKFLPLLQDAAYFWQIQGRLGKSWPVLCSISNRSVFCLQPGTLP